MPAWPMAPILTNYGSRSTVQKLKHCYDERSPIHCEMS